MLSYVRQRIGDETVWRAVLGDALVEIHAMELSQGGRFQGSALVTCGEVRTEYVSEMTFPTAEIAQVHCSLWVEMTLNDL